MRSAARSRRIPNIQRSHSGRNRGRFLARKAVLTAHNRPERSKRLARLRHDFIDDTAAAVERLIIGAPETEILDALHILSHGAVWQFGDRRADRWGDHLISFRNGRV